ncbi:hypothetical protein M8J75_000576 [Diaphorina citri]|nr:hypothetical protein M8J75_000576 [Diaphorina citri]
MKLTNNLSNVLSDWSNEKGKIGAIFSSEFWDQYEKYQEVHRQARELLREKNQDEEFVELCRHRRGAAQYTLESILQLPIGSIVDHTLQKVTLQCAEFLIPPATNYKPSRF